MKHGKFFGLAVRGAWIAAITILCSLAMADENREGYILKVGEGEDMGGPIIKVSPKTGSNGAVLINEHYPDRASSGTHYHRQADEIFYIVSGNGFVRMNGGEHPIGEGDVIFVPAGTDHALFTLNGPMQTMTFLDQPGLAEEFRAWHARFGAAWPASLAQLNEIANRHGTVYKTYFNGSEEVSDP